MLVLLLFPFFSSLSKKEELRIQNDISNENHLSVKCLPLYLSAFRLVLVLRYMNHVSPGVCAYVCELAHLSYLYITQKEKNEFLK